MDVMGIRTFRGSASGSKNNAAEWFSSDLTFDRHMKLAISIGVSGAMTLEVTKDSGSTWGNGYTFGGAEVQELTLYVKAGDLLNFRQSSGGAITVRNCDVFEVD